MELNINFHNTDHQYIIYSKCTLIFKIYLTFYRTMCIVLILNKEVKIAMQSCACERYKGAYGQ